VLFLVVLFVGSGCAALIYEVIWLQLLELLVGSSAVSLGIVLGTFMGGMCVGSLLLPRLVSLRRHPLRVYAALEAGIGLAALALLFGIPSLSGVYAATGGPLIVRVLIAGVCLLPPTMLMGATLPAISRWVTLTPSGVRWLGWFYGGNLAGAVAGSLLAGFYLLRVFDMATTTYLAAAINACVAAASWTLARRAPYTPSEVVASPAGSAPAGRAVYLVAALSGFTALGCEVIWTRLLSLTFGATVYTFSLILALFLFGLGLGSAIGSATARRADAARTALGWCQAIVVAAIAWSAYMLLRVLPYWPIPDMVRTDVWRTFQLDLLRAAVVVLPGAIAWGASFPLAIASLAERGRDAARLVGGVYAANTVGAIAGALGTSLVIAASLGSQRGLQLTVLVAAVASAIAANRRRWLWLAPLAAGVVLAWTIAPVPDVLAAYGRRSAEWDGLTNILYAAEGRSTFVAVSRGSNGVVNYHAAGKVQASVQAEDMRLQRLLAHLSHLLVKQPANVLVIGCGAGITAGALSIAPGVEHLKIAEIEPLAARAAAAYFGEYNYHVLDNPRASLHIDDGRHFLSTTNETFDIITTDMVDPWVKGIATLFTREFFETAKRHLTRGGIVTQFVQLYQTNAETVKSEIATFAQVFPHAIIFGNTNNGQGYDLVLVGESESDQPPIDVDAVQARLDSAPYAAVAQSLREIGIESAVQLFSTYAVSASDLAPWLHDASINTDRNLRLQYLAGLGLNLDDSGAIYLEMLQFAKFPDALFTGSPESLAALRTRWAMGQ